MVIESEPMAQSRPALILPTWHLTDCRLRDDSMPIIDELVGRASDGRTRPKRRARIHANGTRQPAGLVAVCILVDMPRER